MKYLKVFTDFEEDLETLSDTECGRLFRAMLRYARTEQVLDLKGNERFLWSGAKKLIDRQRDSYRNKVDGAEKARKAKNNNSDINLINSDIKTNQNENSDIKNKTLISKQDKDYDYDKDKDQDKDTTTKSLTGTSNLAVGGGDPDLEDIVRLWDKVSGCRLSAWDAETLSTLLAKHGKEKLTHAINVAAGNGAPRLAYVDAVLRNRGKARNKPKEKKRSGKFAEIYEKY